MPSCSLSPQPTHLDALIMTSIAMVKANSEMVHPAMMPISRTWCSYMCWSTTEYPQYMPRLTLKSSQGPERK